MMSPRNPRASTGVEASCARNALTPTCREQTRQAMVRVGPSVCLSQNENDALRHHGHSYVTCGLPEKRHLVGFILRPCRHSGPCAIRSDGVTDAALVEGP